ncbi:MAG: carboxymuconolactone decarboxylase family protein [Candidatus Korobacteraceae bacterium]
MARVELIQPESASQEVMHIYEHRLKGRPAEVHKAMAHLPQTLTSFLAFYTTVGRTIERRLYELVYIRVAQVNGCNYCMQQHAASAKRANILTDEDLQQLQNPAASAAFSDTEKAVLAFAEKLTRTSSAMNDEDSESLRRHGFNDAQIVDLHLLVGLANLTNRFTDPLALKLEPPREKP